MSRTRVALGSVLLGAAILVSGCASALGEPPEVAELAGRPTGDSAGSAKDAASLCHEANELVGRGAVDDARRLFLEAATVDETCLECYLGASRAISWLIEHEDEASRREDLAVEGVQVGQLCERSIPAAPECRYRLALAVGQQARERPSTATDGLDVMVELLEGLVDQTPTMDSAGPHRVLALVLLRAPGWPTGPGDPELALEHARVAVDLVPGHPPNQLVLGEALVENDHRAEGRRAIEKGIELATGLATSGHPDAREWREEGEEALDDLD